MSRAGGIPWLVALLTLLGLLAGCGTLPGGGGEPRSGPMPEITDEPPAIDQSDRRLPAPVVALVAEARAHSATGDHEAAAAKLERALRVAPQNPVLWQNLAVVRYRQDRYAEAVNLAERSNSLAGDDPALRRENWALIAVARDLLGDADGAAAARRQAGQLAPASQ
jgi:tetratricopeptide (TPR) repeat protein